jgi:hypothetical protein
MVLFNPDGKIKKYNNVSEILEVLFDFYYKGILCLEVRFVREKKIIFNFQSNERYRYTFKQKKVYSRSH